MINKMNIAAFCEERDFVDIKMRASHLEYINDNSLFYTLNAGKKGGKSWIKPYNLPQLLHHDKHTDPVGRVIDYAVSNTKKDVNPLDGEPENFMLLTIRISDKKAMANVLKGLYNTGSVGSSANKVICSECGQVITEDGLCEHDKGTLNAKGKPIYWIIDNIIYRENSFVNTPADSWSRIVDINLGNGYVPYNDFLDNREEMIELIMEDSMIKYVKLSADNRDKLPESIFCGPGRTFPSHDEAHVKSGLKLVDSLELSDETKNKIKGTLYRKGKRFNITPTDEELTTNPELLLYRKDEEFTDEEKTSLEDYFKANPEADLPEENLPIEDSIDEEVNDSISFDDIKKKNKSDIIAYTETIIKEHTDTISTYTKEVNDLKDNITTLTKEVSDKDSILNAKEDEISKLLDDNAELDNKYKKALVSTILDLRETSVEDSDDEVTKKYMTRSIDSLLDTINDLRSLNLDNQPPKVEDPTLVDDTTDNNNTEIEDDEDSDELTPPDSLKDSKLAVFFTTKN